MFCNNSGELNGGEELASSKKSKRVTKCKSKVEYSYGKSNMLIECKGCDGSSDLGNEICLEQVLKELEEKTHIDSLILSGYAEKQYTELGIDLINILNKVSSELMRWSKRNPVEEFIKMNKKSTTAEQKAQTKTCDGCELHPYKLYASLTDSFREDIPAFYKLFINHSMKLKNNRIPHNCRNSKCVEDTSKQFVYLFTLIDELEIWVMENAYNRPPPRKIEYLTG